MAKSDSSSRSSSSSDSDDIVPLNKKRSKGPPPPPPKPKSLSSSSSSSSSLPSPQESKQSLRRPSALGRIASETRELPTPEGKQSLRNPKGPPPAPARMAPARMVSETPELPQMPVAKLFEIPDSPPVVKADGEPVVSKAPTMKQSIKFKNIPGTSSEEQPKPQKAALEPTSSVIKRRDSGRVEMAQKDPVFRRQLQEEFEKNLRPEIERQVERELRPQLERDLRPQLERDLRPQLEREIRPQLERELRPQLEKELHPQLERTIKAEVEANTRKNLEQEYEFKRRSMEEEYEDKVRKKVDKDITTLKEKWDEDMKKEIGKLQHEIELKNMEIKQKQEEKDHEAKQGTMKLQAMTESVQTLSTSISQLKEINDTLKLSLREKEEKCQINHERMQAITAKSDSVLNQLGSMIPIKEAKRLAFRALTKGRAVEVLYRVGLMSSIIAGFRKDAFRALATNAHGENFADSLQERGRVTGRLMQNDVSQAKFQEFRREQMWLLSENERLMQKVSELQNGAHGSKGMHEVALRESDVLRHTNKDEAWRKLSAIFYLGRRIHCLNCQQSMHKLRISAIFIAEHNLIEDMENKFNALRLEAYTDMAGRIASNIFSHLTKIVRFHYISQCFYRLSLNSKIQEYREQVAAEKDEEDKAEKYFLRKQKPFYPDTKSPLASYSNENFLQHASMPTAHKPPYYRDLPSVKMQLPQNVFIAMRSDSMAPNASMAFHNFHSSLDERFARSMSGEETSEASNSQLEPTQKMLSLKQSVQSDSNSPKSFSSRIPKSPYETPEIADDDQKITMFRTRMAQQDLQKILHQSPPSQLEKMGTQFKSGKSGELWQRKSSPDHRISSYSLKSASSSSNKFPPPTSGRRRSRSLSLRTNVSRQPSSSLSPKSSFSKANGRLEEKVGALTSKGPPPPPIGKGPHDQVSWPSKGPPPPPIGKGPPPPPIGKGPYDQVSWPNSLSPASSLLKTPGYATPNFGETLK